MSNSFKNFVISKISQINKISILFTKHCANFNVSKFLSILQSQKEKKNMIKRINYMRICYFNYGKISCQNKSLLIGFLINGSISDFKSMIPQLILEVQDFQDCGIQLSLVDRKSVKECLNGQYTRRLRIFFVQQDYF